jgi:hypothetical protein
MTKQNIDTEADPRQGDQIERLFTLGVTKVAQIFGYSLTQKNLCINLDKKWTGYTLGDFFTNSPSGFQGADPEIVS